MSLSTVPAGPAITRSAAVPDNILELDRKETIRDYAMAYGDKIADAYEADQLVFFPYFPLPTDPRLFQHMSFPAEWKKVGVHSGLTKDVLVFRNNTIEVDGEHPLVKSIGNAQFAAYVQHQLSMAVVGIDAAVARLFPAYRSLSLINCTFRFTETRDEGMHIDSFHDGVALPDQLKQKHRLKVFINIDSLPRQWRTSFDVWQILDRYSEQLPHPLPNDLNVLNLKINQSGLLATVPYHEINFPPLSAVVANSEVIAHQVLFGRRTIVAEYHCDARDMRDPKRLSHARLAERLA